MNSQENTPPQESDERREKNRKKIQKKAQVKKADDASMAFFLQTVLYSSFLSVVTFLLFLHENEYPLIIDNNILPEVVACCGVLFAISVVLTLVSSVHRLVLNLFLSVLTGLAAAYILGVLFPVNFGEALLHHLPDFSAGFSAFLAKNGNMLAGVAASVLMFFLLWTYKSGFLGLCTLPLLCAAIYLMNAGASRPLPDIATAKPVTFEEENAPAKPSNIVYLLLTDHAGYDYSLLKWQKETRQKGDGLVPFFVADFYKENNFDFYPKAHTRHLQRYKNIGGLVNPKSTELPDDLFAYADSVHYKGDEDARVILTKNDLFKHFKNDGYRITVYQSHPVDFCKSADGPVDKCVSYPAPLGFIYNAPMATADKAILLAGEWLNSAPLTKEILTFARKKLVDRRMISAQTLFLGNPVSKALPLGQQEILTRLKNDVLTASGKNVFFAHIALPYEPYMYDASCKLIPQPEKWTLASPSDARLDSKGEKNRWKQYVAQTNCLYGHLNTFMEALKKADVLKNTKIVITSDKGADIGEDAYALRNMSPFDRNMAEIKKNVSTIFAVYDPDLKNPERHADACDTATLTGRYLLGDKDAVCQDTDLKAKRLADNEIREVQMYLTQPAADPRYNDPSDLKKWYADWLANGGEALTAALDEEYKQTEIRESNKKGNVKFIAPQEFSRLNEAKRNREKKKKQKTVNVPVPAQLPDDLPIADDNAPVEENASTEENALAAELPEDTPAENETKKTEEPVKTPDETETAEKQEITETSAAKPAEQEVTVPDAPPATKPDTKKTAAQPASEIPAVEEVEEEIEAIVVIEPAPAAKPVPHKADAVSATPATPVKKKADASAAGEKIKARKPQAEKPATTPAEQKADEPTEAKPDTKKVTAPTASAKKPVQNKVVAPVAPAATEHKKTTASIVLPETSAKDVWHLDNADKPKQPEKDTSAALSDLDDLEKEFLELDVEEATPQTTDLPELSEQTPVPAAKPAKQKTDEPTATKPDTTKAAIPPVKKPVPHKVDAPTASDAVSAALAPDAPTASAAPAVEEKIETIVVIEPAPDTSTATPAKKKTDTHQPAKKSVQSKVIAPTASAKKPAPHKADAVSATPASAKKSDTKKVAAQPAKKPVPHKVDAPVVSNAEPASVAVSATPVHATPASAAQSTLEKRRPVTNGEQVEITRDFVTKRTNVYGTPETFILIERTNVPGKVLTPAQLDALIEKAQ